MAYCLPRLGAKSVGSMRAIREGAYFLRADLRADPPGSLDRNLKLQEQTHEQTIW